MAPKNPCIDCKKEVKTKSISCCICQRWVHGDCVGPETYNLVVAMTERSGFHCWSCEGCTSAYKQLSNACAANTREINELKQTVEDLKSKTKKNEDNITATNANVASIQNDLKERKEEALSYAENTADQVLREITDRNSRKKNLVFYGIPEANSELPGHIKKCQDKLEALEVLSEVDCAVDIDTNIKFATRLGKVSEEINEPRPLLVGFDTEEIRNEIIGAAYKLKYSEMSNVSIAPDLTAKQRKEESRLRTEANKRNEEMDPEDAKNWTWRLVGPRGEQKLIKQRKKEQEPQKSQIRQKRKRPTRTANPDQDQSEESQEDILPPAKKQ